MTATDEPSDPPDPDAAAPAGRWRRRLPTVVLRGLGLLLSAGCVWILVDALSDQMGRLREAGGLPDATGLAVAVGISLVANLLLADTWRMLMGLGGQPMPRRTAMWIWSVGQLARYAFGPLLVAARAAATRGQDRSGTAAAVTSVLEVLLLITTSAAIVLATLPAWAPTGRAPDWLAAAGLVPVAVLVLVIARPAATLRLAARLASLPQLPAAVRRRLEPLAGAMSMTSRDVLVVSLRHAINWGLRLAVFLVVVRSTGTALDPIAALIGAYAVGVFVGFLAIFSPGGLGVRELGTAALLAPVTGQGVALITVAAVRVAEIVAEVLGTVAAGLLRPGGRRR